MHLRRIHRAADVPTGAWWVWGGAAAIYFLALFHRMSLGVASLEASERLGISVDTIALLSALQLALYAALVIPAGVAADRIGPRRSLAGGLALIGSGQIIFGLAHDPIPALVGRGMIGIGDAFIFLSVLRLAQNWFPARRYALLSLLTALAGALGQIGTTVPLGSALDALGWQPVFIGAGAVTVGMIAVCLCGLRDRPRGAAAAGTAGGVAGRTDSASIRRAVLLAWRAPGTRLGFWTHFSLMGPFVAVTALWGYPLLVEGRGMGEGPARAWLLVAVVACAVASPILGLIMARARDLRDAMALGIAITVGLLWLGALALPGAPLALTLVALVGTGPTCAAAMLAFDAAREGNPAERVGTATGVVNTGGFSAAVVVQVAGAVLLALQGGDPNYNLALLPLPLLIGLGCVQMVRYRRAVVRLRAGNRGRDAVGPAPIGARPRSPAG